MTELHCRHLKSDIDQYVSQSQRNWSIKPSLAEKLVDILAFMADKREITTDDIVSEFGFTATTARRYMRQLTEFGYLEAQGGNKNRSYNKK